MNNNIYGKRAYDKHRHRAPVQTCDNHLLDNFQSINHFISGNTAHIKNTEKGQRTEEKYGNIQVKHAYTKLHNNYTNTT